DLHTFSRQSPFLVGFTDSEGAVQQNVQKMIQLLQPDIIWKVNEKKGEDRRFQGSLDGALTEKGIPSVFIEMPNYQMISDEMIRRISDGLVSVFNGFTSSDVPKKDILVFSAKYIYSDDAGLFHPKVLLLQKIQKGDVIGEVSLFPSFEKKKITSPFTGTILTIKGKDVIRTGTKLGSIGV
ncbi:succinylglutamate desuccinylase/aspartoacylase family protein, partial [Patescibacteria group bacterium]